jgi:hypothetical protein
MEYGSLDLKEQEVQNRADKLFMVVQDKFPRI